jgi:GntR family transcriptional regulator
VKARIEGGEWTPGQRLPTVRGLAATLDLNFNTVRVVYRDLVQQGYLATRQGRGTVVVAQPPRLPDGDPERRTVGVSALVDAAACGARASGVPVDMLARAVRAAYARAKDMPADARFLLVECNAPDLEHHAAEIARGIGVQPETATIAQLRGSAATACAHFDLVVTTLFHVAEVQDLVGPRQPVLGVPVTLSYEGVILPLSRARRGAHIGLVCATQEGARGMERMLAGVGLGHVCYRTAGLDRPGEMEDVFDRTESVYVSRMGLRAHGGHWPREHITHAYVTGLDTTALCVVRRAMAAAQHARTAQ